MNAGIEPAGTRAIADRAKAILLKPAEEWPLIEAENKSQREILTGYVLPLAAIGPVATLIGSQVFGYGALGFSFRPSFMSALVSAIISYGLSIAAVFVLMLIADFLAPKFEGQSNRLNAFKLVAYSYTAGWLAGIFGLIPALGFFGLLGLYSIYLIYTGAPVMMKVPQAKAGGYTAVTIACAILLAIIVMPITAAITGMIGMGAMSGMTAPADSAGTVTLPGGKEMDLGKVEELGRKMENAGNTPPVEAEKIKELLPAAIGSYQRDSVETTAMGSMGSTAVATYKAGDRSFRLTVSDMSAIGALAGLGAAMGVEQSREDADGYERTTSVDGQMQTEAWNRASSSGKFARVIADRFMVEAEGSAGSIDELKSAVAQIDPDDLTELVD